MARFGGIRTRVVTALALTAAVVAAGLVSSAEAQTCPNQPLLRDVTIGQGLPYSNGTATNSVLVSGKSTLVRFYLSEQECADRDMLLNSASLIINDDTANPIAAQQTLVPGAPISNHSSAAAINSTGDPLFIVPASRLAADSTVSFRVDTTFTPKNGSLTSASFTTFGGAAIQRKVYGATAPLRILAVPMGDERYLFPDAKNNQVPQLSATGVTNATAGFTGLSRMFPVADGTGTLGLAGGGGVRYFLDEAGLVNVRDFMNDGDGDLNRDATYCEGGFSTDVVPQLSDFRLNFNTVGNSEPAARVLGLVDESLSNPGVSCSRGRAAVGGREAWVKTYAGKTAALMTMEEAHNFGAVPDSRDGTSGLATHSTQEQADQFNSTFVNRGYNLATGRYIDSDRTALRYFETSWDDNNVLLEKLDWDMIFCKQGGPTTTNTDCSVTGSSGAVGAVAPLTAVMGSTDFTAAGTDVFDSFTADGLPTDEPQTDSRLRLREVDASGAVVSDRGVSLSELATLHHEDGNAHGHEGFSFGLAIPTHPDAAGWRLVDASDSEVLAGADETAPPVIESMTATQDFPQGCVGCTDFSAAILDDEGRFNPDQAERITFEEDCCANGELITDQYAEEGVIFDDPDDGTPGIIGDCGVEGEPCRFRWETSSPTRNLVNHTQQPDGQPNSGPLTMRFPVPVRKLGMYMGNGGTQVVDGGPEQDPAIVQTHGVLTLFNSNGDVIGTHSKPVNDNVDTFIGFDAGESAIASATLEYFPATTDESDGPTEAIDDLMFEDFADTGQASVDVEVSDPDGGSDLSVTYFAKCGDLTVPIAVNKSPEDVPDEDFDSAFFSYQADTENLCAEDGEATILARVNDGYSTDTAQTTVESSADHAPTPAITGPVDGAKILEHAAIRTEGAGNDFEDGAVPSGQLAWELSGPSGSATGTGTSVNIPAPANGWTPGSYTATLTATDSDGNSESAVRTFEVVTDDDNDGVPAAAEACAGGSDADPFDNEVDGDHDGFANRDDSNPCTPESKYDAAVDFDPNTLNITSQGESVKFDVRLRYRNVADVVGATVKITKIDGVKVEDLEPVAGPPGGIPNISWQVNRGVGTARFDRQLLVSLLSANGIYDKDVVLTLGGGGATLVGGTTQTWEFAGSDAPRVINKG